MGLAERKLHFSCKRPWKPMMSWAVMLPLLLFVLAAAEDPSPLNHWPLPPLLGRVFRGTRVAGLCLLYVCIAWQVLHQRLGLSHMSPLRCFPHPCVQLQC